VPRGKLENSTFDLELPAGRLVTLNVVEGFGRKNTLDQFHLGFEGKG